MKRFFENTLISGAYSKALRVVALLCVLLGVSTSALADAGFHSTDAWNFLYYPGTGGDTWVSGGINNGETKDLGTLSGTPYMKGLLAKTWKTKNAGNVCSVTAKYKIDNGSEQSVSLDSWSDLGESNGSVNQQLKKEGLNIAMPTTPGAHTISFTFTANVNKSGTGNCNATVTMNGAITYTIAAQHYWLKHPWDGGDWYWKEMDDKNQLTATYRGNCMNCSQTKDEGSSCLTPVSSCGSAINSGTECVFKYDPSTNTITMTPTAGCGSSSSLPTQVGACQKIDIYSKDNVNLYAFKDGQPIAGYNWDGGVNTNPKGTKTTYNGSTYYQWSINGYDYIQIVFRNGELSKQSGDSPVLYGGYTYVFDGGFIQDSKPTPTPASYTTVDCGDSETADCNSNEIQIWCKGKNNNIDMYCYAWEEGNDTNHPLGNWCGTLKQSTGSYNGAQYAVWTVDCNTWNINNNLNVIFNDCSGTQTANLMGLEKGYRYIFDLTRKPDGTTLSEWKDQVVYSQRSACGGSGEVEEVHNGSLYLNLSSFTDWAKDNAVLKAKMIKKDGSSDLINLIQCTSEPNIYYFESVINLANYTKVQMLRINPDDANHTWNTSAEHPFSNKLTCVNITGWDSNSNISEYTGTCTVSTSSVLIGKQAEVSLEGDKVSLYGYLSYTFCNANLSEYGFVYCQGSATQGCTPNRNSPRIRVQGGVTHLIRGEEFSVSNYDGLVQGYTYGYKAYVMMGDMMMLSDETGYFTLADCTTRPTAGETLTYTIDASLGVTYENACTLTYGSLETAIKRLKESWEDEEEDYQYVTKVSTKNGDSYNLKQDVVMNIRFYDDTPDETGKAYAYAGTKKVTSAGSDKVDGGTNLALLIDFINLGATEDYTLTIKADNPLVQPWVHHAIIRNSRNVTLDGLALYSDPSGKINDCAFEIDVNTTKWDTISVGAVKNANILIKNCYIGASGFSGIHASGYEGITFINNDIEATFKGSTDNDKEWGASAKFMACKNIKFIQNNFRGDHCTLLWLQECQDAVFMNNVFWNTNKFLDTTGKYTPAAIRLVTQFGRALQNIGYFYNTSYFAQNTTVSTSRYDYMSFKVGSGNTSGSSADFKLDKIYFLYNNCYSYDEDCPGRSDSPFLGLTLPEANFCGNNFWSAYDDIKGNTKSAFAFGCAANTFVNVASQVCETTATGPASLVVKEDELNFGSPLTAANVKTYTNVEVTEVEVTSDRLTSEVRKNETTWTAGAYQQGINKDTKVIIWQGVTSNNWDDRNNWLDAETGNRLTCLNNLTEDLKVIIPSANSEVYPTPSHGVLYWPNIPSSFYYATRIEENGIPKAEQVTANSKEFAKTIELEYGAGITGVENLVNGDERHYTNAIVGFTAPRQQWILVGTVIMPKDAKTGKYRNIVSGDYFITNQMPHVYMHEAKLVETTNSNGETEWITTWDETFADLNIEVPSTKVFAINLADQYGKYKLPASYYNSFNPGANVDPWAPHTYKNFDGKFVNDEAMPNYTGLSAGVPVLLNNSYPVNIDAKKLENLTGGTIQYYDGSWKNTEATSGDVLLRPQHGFVFTPAEGKDYLSITKDMLAGGDTKSRNAEVKLPTLSLNLFNANTGVESSNVVVKIDELLAESEIASTNVKKVFSPNEAYPELYIVANDEMYSRYTTNSTSVVIPLGVRLKKDMNIKFSREYFENFSEATLVDTYTGKETNLLRNTYTTETLVAGTIEGRFFLNLGVVVEEEEETPEEGDNITTEVEESEMANGAINIFVNNDNTIKVITNQVELKTIYVSDMAGRTMKYDVKGYAAKLKLPVAQGVYTVSVIGDTANRTEKVMLK